MGAKFDPSVWGQRGHRIVRLHGQLYHLIGSLLPEPRKAPQFSQLYIMDGTQDDMAHARVSHAHDQVDETIVLRLQVRHRFHVFNCFSNWIHRTFWNAVTILT